MSHLRPLHVFHHFLKHLLHAMTNIYPTILQQFSESYGLHVFHLFFPTCSTFTLMSYLIHSIDFLFPFYIKRYDLLLYFPTFSNMFILSSGMTKVFHRFPIFLSGVRLASFHHFNYYNLIKCMTNMFSIILPSIQAVYLSNVRLTCIPSFSYILTSITHMT